MMGAARLRSASAAAVVEGVGGGATGMPTIGGAVTSAWMSCDGPAASGAVTRAVLLRVEARMEASQSLQVASHALSLSPP